MPKVTLPISERAGIWPENVNYMWTPVLFLFFKIGPYILFFGLYFIHLTNIYREAAIESTSVSDAEDIAMTKVPTFKYLILGY